MLRQDFSGHPHHPHHPRGSIMFVGLMIVTILAMLALGFTGNITTNQSRFENDVAGTRALALAQAYVNTKAQQLWSQYWRQPANARLNWVQANCRNYADTAFTPCAEGQACCLINYQPVANGCDVYFRAVAVVESYGAGGVGVDTVKDGSGNTVTFSGMRTVAREIQLVCRYSVGTSKVFQFVYFANNYGWMYGSTLNLYGAMGANGNLGFSGGPKVDGSMFAALNSSIGAPGIVNGAANHDSLTQYRNLAMGPDGIVNTNDDNRAMIPTNPAAPGVPFGPGYDGTQPQSTAQTPLNMPYLADLSVYTNMAQSTPVQPRPDLGEPAGRTGGIIKQLKAPGLDPTNPANYNVIVDKTYGYNSELGAYATPTIDPKTGQITQVDMIPMTGALDGANPKNNGNLALVGTPDQPLIVLGPVVISHDLVIKGTMAGQGTIYTGRNINVLGDLTYANAPQWTQNDFNINQPGSGTAAQNQNKDGVGFGAKGNVVFGDYTHASPSGGDGGDYWDGALAYIKPPFTAAYPVDPGDADNGYVTSNQNGVPTFNGDYTQKDGGSKFDSSKNKAMTSRRYYESSFSNDYVHSLATNNDAPGVTGKPAVVSGIFYCNHYLGGRLNNPSMYGTAVMRDEAMVVDGGLSMFYDPRIMDENVSSKVNVYLPVDAQFTTQVFSELRDPSNGLPMLDQGSTPNTGSSGWGPAPIPQFKKDGTPAAPGDASNPCVFPPIPTRLNY